MTEKINYIPNKQILYNLLKYSFYTLLLIELNYNNTYYFKNYLNELTINLMLLDSSLIDIKDIKDPQDLKLELEGLIKNILKNLIKKSR